MVCVCLLIAFLVSDVKVWFQSRLSLKLNGVDDMIIV